MSSKKIGRFALLKYYLIFLIIVLSIPVIVEIVSRESIDFSSAVIEAYKLRSLDSRSIVFLFIQLMVVLIGGWIFGGKIGEAIIDRGKSKFTLSFMAIFKMWLLYFICGTILTVLSNDNSIPINLMINSIVTLLYFSIILGILHGLVVAYFIGKEIERKGHN